MWPDTRASLTYSLGAKVAGEKRAGTLAVTDRAGMTALILTQEMVS